jgi:hypothetical protein
VSARKDNDAGPHPFVCKVWTFASSPVAQQCGLGGREGIPASVPLRPSLCTAGINVGRLSRWLTRPAHPRQLTPDSGSRGQCSCCTIWRHRTVVNAHLSARCTIVTQGDPGCRSVGLPEGRAHDGGTCFKQDIFSPEPSGTVGIEPANPESLDRKQ